LKNFPKVLIITPETFGGKSSSSQLLKNLFKEWPIHNLAQIFLSGGEIDYDLCLNYWKFPNSNFLFNKGAVILRPTVSDYACTGEEAGSVKQSKFTKWKRYFEPIIDMFPLHHSNDFLQWVSEYNPEIIYTWLGCRRLIQLSIFLSEKLQIPLVPHFMDNWVLASPYDFYLLDKLHRFNIKRSLKSIEPYMRMGIAISPRMADTYSDLFKIPFEVVSNGVNDELIWRSIEGPIDSVTEIKNEYVFAILGRLEYGRINTLNRLLDNLESFEDFKFVVNVYSESFFDFRQDRKNVDVFFFNPPDDLLFFETSDKINSYIYIDDFELSNSRFFNLSFSSKIPIYLATGKPIITIGPIENYSVSFLSECNVGPVITSLKELDFSLAINKMLHYTNRDLQEIAENAKKIVTMELSASAQRKKLRNILLSNLDR